MAAGYRGHIAPWVGGLSSPPAGAAASGRRSHLFFWIGGLSSPVVTPQPDAPAAAGGRLVSGRANRIRHQNQALIAALTAMAAQGAFN